MALNIGEANAVNVLLRALVSVSDVWADVPAEIVQAAELLADGANKVLHAGLTGERVVAALEGDGLL